MAFARRLPLPLPLALPPACRFVERMPEGSMLLRTLLSPRASSDTTFPLLGRLPEDDPRWLAGWLPAEAAMSPCDPARLPEALLPLARVPGWCGLGASAMVARSDQPAERDLPRDRGAGGECMGDAAMATDPVW